MSTAAVTRRSAGRRGSGRDKPIANAAGPSAPSSSTSAVIDVEAIEDEVETLSPSRVPAALRRGRPRRRPTTVVIDEDCEIESRHQAGAPARPTRKRQRTTGTSVLDISSDHEEISSAQQVSSWQTNEEAAKLAPEPTFICPVCLNKLAEASSTICGHIFCEACIWASVKAQKKCPTCRRKLTVSNFHRVYLPGAD